MFHLLIHWLGMDDLSGPVYAAWSGWVGDVAIIAGACALLRRLVLHHREHLAQAARHHRERKAQARAHHEELKEHVAAAVRRSPSKVIARQKGRDSN